MDNAEEIFREDYLFTREDILQSLEFVTVRQWIRRGKLRHAKVTNNHEIFVDVLAKI